MTATTSLAPLLQSFFTSRLMRQKQASPHTVCSYRDTFRLLLRFLGKKLRKSPSCLLLDDVEAPSIVAFLDELEALRGVSPRSRNLRLTAIRSFFRYVAFESPTHAGQIQRVLAIPAKRYQRTLIAFLIRPEVEALLQAPDLTTWSGRRDHALILLALQTGLRLSEIIAVKREDLSFGTGAHVRVLGKGRKERCTPLARRTTEVLKQWLKEPPRGNEGLLFTNACGGRFSPDGVQYIVAKHVAATAVACPSIAREAGDATRLSPHGGNGVTSGRRGSNSDRLVAGT